MKKIFIYSLSYNNTPFYIGKTNNIRTRYSQHLQDKRFPVGFEMDTIEITNEDEWEFWEKHYISLFKTWGFKLLNIHEGGKIEFSITGEFKNKLKSSSNIQLYCKCENCLSIFPIATKLRHYCSDSCKKKAYYKRKIKQSVV